MMTRQLPYDPLLASVMFNEFAKLKRSANNYTIMIAPITAKLETYRLSEFHQVI